MKKNLNRALFALCVAGAACAAVLSCNGGPTGVSNCAGGCPQNEVCVNGACVNGCATDQQCGTGQICVNGTCFTKGCTTNADCGAGRICQGDICVPAPPDGGHLPDGGPLPDAGPRPDAGPPPDAGPRPDAGPGLDGGICPSAALLIYVIDINGTLSTFDPTQNPPVFHDLGTLSCPGSSGSPFSMTVDRQGYAWVEYGNAGGPTTGLYKVDTLNLSCTPTSFNPNHDSIFSPAGFGMGYVRDGGAGTELGDDLYIASLTGVSGGFYNFGLINTTNGTPARLSSQTTTWGSPELTGTSDGRLFGFFPGWCDTGSSTAWPAYVFQLNKTNGAQMGSGMIASDVFSGGDSCSSQVLDYAFAWYGGNFWLFTQSQNDSATEVRKMSSSGSVTDVMGTGSRTILGAGVSTCVPTH